MINRWVKTIFAAVVMIALLAGCGSIGSAMQTDKAAAKAPVKSAASDTGLYYAAQNEAYYSDDGMPWESEPAAAYDQDPGGMTSDPAGESDRADSYDKIIYSGSANVETIRFDETVDQVYQMIDRYQGFLESSYVTGRDYSSQYYDRYSYRNAQFVIRVPRENFSSLRSDLDTLGNVTYSSVGAQNITNEYRDTESRMKAYRVEESRLLEMLEKAENVDDMLNIEDRLSNVRYQIESLTTTLNNWDSKINYSTMCLSVQEVKELTIEKPIARTFGEDLRDGIRSSWEWLGQAGKSIVIFVVSALPLLVVPAIIALVIILLIHHSRRKKKKITALHQTNDVKVDN